MTPERQEVCRHVEVTLKEYFEARFESIDLSTRLARENIEHRLQELNELRKEYTHDRNQFVTRELYEGLHARLQKEVTDLKAAVSKWGIITGIIVTVVQIGSPIALYFLLHH